MTITLPVSQTNNFQSDNWKLYHIWNNSYGLLFNVLLIWPQKTQYCDFLLKSDDGALNTISAKKLKSVYTQKVLRRVKEETEHFGLIKIRMLV